jgi:hypothetical protein
MRARPACDGANFSRVNAFVCSAGAQRAHGGGTLVYHTVSHVENAYSAFWLAVRWVQTSVAAEESGVVDGEDFVERRLWRRGDRWARTCLTH